MHIKSRLDLIEIAANVLGNLRDVREREEMRLLIVSLCHHRDLPACTCLSLPNERILNRDSSGAFAHWQIEYDAMKRESGAKV